MTSSETTAALTEKLALIGHRGREAGRSLEAACWYLENGQPREAVGRGVAAHIRGALDSLFAYASTPSIPNQLSRASSEVVEAKRMYERSIEVDNGNAARALDELMGRIAALDELQQNEQFKNQRRAAALIVRLKGAQAPVGDPAPVIRIARLYGTASIQVHHGCSEDKSRELLAEVEETLWTLFRPPDLLDARLRELAQQEDPSDAVVKEAVGLHISKRDWEAFLELVPTPAWLQKLNQGKFPLDPPSQSRGRWIARAAVVRLSKDYRKEAIDWIKEIATRRRRDPAICLSLANALLDMEPPDIAEALRVAERHLGEGMLLFRVVDALREESDPSNPLVNKAADLFLSTLVQGPVGPNPTLAGGPEENFYMVLLGMLSDGATPDNAADRIRTLTHKLKKAYDLWELPDWYAGMAEMLGGSSEEIPPDLWMFPLNCSPDVPISSLGQSGADEYGAKAVCAITACLVRVFRTALPSLPASTLVDLAALVPEPLGHRLRLWALAEASEVNPEAIVEEIELAIPTRAPTYDDLALIDRAVSPFSGGEGDFSGYTSRWQTALGSPPSPSEATQAVVSDSTWRGRDWLYPYLWVPILPAAATSTWTGCEAFHLLAAELPPRGRSEFEEIAEQSHEPEMPVRSGPERLLLDPHELGLMEPAQAAQELASCPASHYGWTHDALALGGLLQRLVEANPSSWGQNPTRIAELLQHPAYIARYLSAFSSLDSEQLATADIDGLVSTIILVGEEPWPVQRTNGASDDLHDSAGDWSEAQRAAIWLVRQLLRTDVGLAGRHEEVWNLLERMAKTLPSKPISVEDEEAGLLASMLHEENQGRPDSDPGHLASNQLNTQALDAALLLAAHEYKSNTQTRPQITALVEWCLDLPGVEGAKCRAVIAAHMEFLLRSIPDWMAENKDQLFRDGILGRIALDQTLRSSWPIEWVSIHFREDIYDAAKRGARRSLNWVVISMLLGMEGYEPESVIGQLDERVLQACEFLARQLDHSVTEVGPQIQTADRFYEQLIENKRHAGSLGWIALTKSMPQNKWEDLTLKALEATSGEIEKPELVLRRIFDNAPTEANARILTFLIEVQCNPDHTPSTDGTPGSSEHADQATWNQMTIANKTPEWLEQGQCAHPSIPAIQQLLETLRRHRLLRNSDSGSPGQTKGQDSED